MTAPASAPLLSIVRGYPTAGRPPLPIAPGQKRPSILTEMGEIIGLDWKAYQVTPADEVTLRHWFPPDRLMGVGIACGPVSGIIRDGIQYGQEVLDFDDAAVLAEFIEQANWLGLGDLIARLPHQRTPGGAGHFPYLCQEWAGNTVLARRHGDPDAGEQPAVTLIETRGAGGQVVAAPTPPGIHPEHPERGYELLRGSWEDLPIIAPEERAALWDLARSFNTYIGAEEVHRGRGAGKLDTSGNRPGDWLNRIADHVWWQDLLERHQWTRIQTRGEVQYWRRPGKEGQAWSATLGACGPYFYVFSASADPFIPERGYSPFSAYALLEHQGDFQAAARALIPPRFAREYPEL